MGDVFLEGVDVVAEGLKAFGSKAACSARHLAFEALLDSDVTRR